MKRVEVKYVRDGIKARYPLRDECFISGSKEDLELHHFFTVSELWEAWKRKNGIVINEVEDVIRERENFYREHEKELLEDVVTLTKYWHQGRLHKIYGQKPKLHTAAKQKRWCQRMRDKHYAKEKQTC